MRIENAINDAVDYFMENPSRSSTGLPSQTDVRLVLNDLVGEEGYGRASQSASVKKVMAKLKKLSKNLLMENPRRIKSFRISYGTGPAMTVKAHTIQEAERIFHKKAKTLRRKLGINMKRKPKGEDLFDFRHRTYLSNANGMWSVIWKGIPLNASTPSRSRAEAVAKQYNVKLPEHIWTEKGWVKDIGQNRRRGLRRNPEKLKPRMIGDMEMRLIKLLAKKRGWTKYSAKRQSYNPYDIVIDGEGPGTRQFAGDLKLIAIRELLNWTLPEIAKMSDYPDMVREGDWSGIRDSSDQAIDKIFEIFVLRRYG